MIDALESFHKYQYDNNYSKSEIALDRTIEATNKRLKDLAPSTQRRHIRTWYKDNYCIMTTTNPDISVD